MNGALRLRETQKTQLECLHVHEAPDKDQMAASLGSRAWLTTVVASGSQLAN